MKSKFLCLIVLFLVSFSFVLANEENISTREIAENCLAESVEIIKELQENNFSIARANDTLKQATNLYDSQVLLVERRGAKGEFELVFPHCETIKNLRLNAFNSRDSFEALQKFYDESFASTGINTSSVDEVLDRVKDEIKSERYERVPELITHAYERIITVKSEHTTLNLFYSSTTRNLKSFLEKNWKTLTISLTLLIVLFLVYKTSIYRALVNKRIANLKTRKESLRNLIMRTQKEYFEGGNMSESNYTIRTKGFAEMIRDIDREIPLLQEKLFLYSGGRSREEAMYAKREEKIKKKEKKKDEKHSNVHQKKLHKEVKKETKKSWRGFKKSHKKLKKVVKSRR